MNCDFTLTPAQQALVESGLPVIDKVIRLFIRPDETVCGLGRDDLYQEGAVALCKAASTYDGTRAVGIRSNMTWKRVSGRDVRILCALSADSPVT